MANQLIARFLSAVTVLFSLISVTAFADENDCNDALTTLQINQCLAQRRAHSKIIMQQYLNEALKQYQSDPVVQKSIQSAQTAWEAYAKAQCDSIYDIWRDGSIRIIMTVTCQTRLIEQRTHQIWSAYLPHKAIPEPTYPSGPE